MKDIFIKSLHSLATWVEANKYKGYEPFDGLNSFLAPLLRGHPLSERILQQAVSRSLLNIRPLLGVKPQESTKGRGYMAWGYLNMFRLTGDSNYAEKAAACLSWLIKNRSPQSSHYSWGNHYPFSTRMGHIPKLEPIVPWTSLIGQVFLDAYELFGDEQYLAVASSSSAWIITLPRTETSRGTCIAYNALRKTTVHGANMLGAALLARTASHTGDDVASHLAQEAMEYSCARQNADGSWPYADELNTSWIDSFHTGYNLDSLYRYVHYTGDKTYFPNMLNGFRFFWSNFFEKTGRPKYYHDRTFPVDIQCASQAIDTLALFADICERSLPLAERVAAWTIQNMQDRRGFFYYRQLPQFTIKTPMLHWGQATMFRALSHLLLRVN